MNGDGVGQNERELRSVYVEILHHYEPALDPLHVVRLAHVIKLHANVLRSDSQYGADGTVHQAGVRVDVAAEHDSRSDGQGESGL